VELRRAQFPARYCASLRSYCTGPPTWLPCALSTTQHSQTVLQVCAFKAPQTVCGGLELQQRPRIDPEGRRHRSTGPSERSYWISHRSFQLGQLGKYSLFAASFRATNRKSIGQDRWPVERGLWSVWARHFAPETSGPRCGRSAMSASQMAAQRALSSPVQRRGAVQRSAAGQLASGPPFQVQRRRLAN